MTVIKIEVYVCVCVCVSVVNVPCVFPQSVGVPRSTDRQWSVRSLRCRVLVRTFKVSSHSLICTRFAVQVQHFIAQMHHFFLRPSAAPHRSDAKKTKVKRKTNNPQFEEVFYFEVFRCVSFQDFFLLFILFQLI